MYHAPLPLPILILLVISFVCYLYKHRDRTANLSDFPTRVPTSEPSLIQSVIDSHTDCTAEIFDVCSYTLNTNPVTMKHVPGDPVELKMVDGNVAVYIDGTFINKLYPTKGSLLKQVVESGHRFHAYIWSRDMEASNPNWMDFLSVVIFYKMEGVPPTKVNLNS